MRSLKPLSRTVDCVVEPHVLNEGNAFTQYILLWILEYATITRLVLHLVSHLQKIELEIEHNRDKTDDRTQKYSPDFLYLYPPPNP